MGSISNNAEIDNQRDSQTQNGLNPPKMSILPKNSTTSSGSHDSEKAEEIRNSRTSKKSNPGAVISDKVTTKDGAEDMFDEQAQSQRKTKMEIARENMSKHLMLLIEDDSKEFSETDVVETLPASPFSDTSFAKLKEFFDSVIQEMTTAHKVGIPLDEVKEEFYFLWDGIQKSHDSLNDLLQKDVDLTILVGDTMAKTRNLIRIAEDQPEITARLGSRLETAWSLVDISEEEAKRNTNRIEELKTDIMILNRNIQAAANMEGQNELTELSKIRRKLQDERDVLHKEMGRMRTSLALLQERKFRLGEKRVEYQDAIKYADEEAAAQNEALKRETARKVGIEKEIEKLAYNIEKKTNELNNIDKYSTHAKVKLLDLEKGATAQKIMNDVAMKEAEGAYAKLEKLRRDFEVQVDLVERLAVETFKKQSDLKDKEDEIIKIKAEGMQAVRQRNTNMRRCAVLQETIDGLESDREALKQKIVELERELEAAQKKLEENRKKVEDLDKKRTMINRNLTRANAVAAEHDNQLKVHLVATNNLEHEMEAYKREITSQTTLIHRLERERDYYSHEATKLAHEYASRLDEIKKMDTIVYEFHKKISELEGTVKTKQQEYEQSLVEKRFFEKLVRDTGTQILEAQTEVRHKTFELNMSIYSYYDEQNKYSKQKSYLENLLREGAFFTTEAFRIRKMAIDVQREVEALEYERSLLGCSVAEAENELSKQRYYAQQADFRKQTYNRRLMQRENELQGIWSNWRTLHSMVRIGAYHFRRLLADIREVRQRIVNLRGLQHKFKGNVSHIVNLQQEISVLENCIAKETCMVNALEDELARPINVHRWRALEAIDPDAYDTIKKINIVTKRLVDQNENIRKQSLRIADKERIYVDLRHVIRRLPSIETPELRRYYDVLLSAKRDQLKKIKLDLYAMESQTKYFRAEVTKINRRMKDLKEAYFDKMKKKKKPRAIGSGMLPPLEKKGSTIGSEVVHLQPFEEYQMSSAKKDSVMIAEEGKQAMTIGSLQNLYEEFTVEQELLELEIQKRKSVLEEKLNRKMSRKESLVEYMDEKD